MADFNEYKGVWVFCEQRQGALMPTDFELVSEARKLADELGCEVTGLLPVSYTHLDVYKRQIIYSSCTDKSLQDVYRLLAI